MAQVICEHQAGVLPQSPSTEPCFTLLCAVTLQDFNHRRGGGDHAAFAVLRGDDIHVVVVGVGHHGVRVDPDAAGCGGGVHCGVDVAGNRLVGIYLSFGGASGGHAGIGQSVARHVVHLGGPERDDQRAGNGGGLSRGDFDGRGDAGFDCD